MSLLSSYLESPVIYLSLLYPLVSIGNTSLADPGFGQPGRINILLGVDVFVDVLLHGRRRGPPEIPTAFETEFGWVLSGCIETNATSNHTVVHVSTFHTSVTSGDDILHKFWEVEESPKNATALSLEERTVVRHFYSTTLVLKKEGLSFHYRENLAPSQ